MEDIMLPGFRFHPTDEELVSFYLKRKVQHRSLSIELIKQLDIYKYDPWDLPKMASGEKEWYFFCPRDRKYRNSMRPNRVTGAGFWKATGTDRPIYSSEGAAKCIGLKKSLVFYKGRAAKGTKTDWMMHEFRLPSENDQSMLPSKKFMDRTIPANDAWAICRIFKKTNATAQRALAQHHWVSSPFFQAENITSDNYNVRLSPDFRSPGSISITPPKYEPVPNINFNQQVIYLQQQQHSCTTTTTSNTDFDFSSYKSPITSTVHKPAHPAPEWTALELPPSSLMIKDVQLCNSQKQLTPRLSCATSVQPMITDDYAAYFEDEQLGISLSPGRSGLPDDDNASLNVWKSNLEWDCSPCPSSEISTSANHLQQNAAL